MLSKQSIRGNVQIYINDVLATKDQLVNLSKTWSDSEEALFRKLLKQGGRFKIKGESYKILVDDQTLNSRGIPDAPITPMDHSGDDIDLNYIR